MTDVNTELSKLLRVLEERVPRSRLRDAVDESLIAPPRTTASASLRDHEVVQRFRRELSDGLVRADTAQQLLSLIRLAVEAATK